MPHTNSRAVRSVTPTDFPTATELADFHAGRLSVDGIVAVAGHLERCPLCPGTPIPSEVVNDELFLFDADRELPERTLNIPGQFKSFDWNPVDGRLAVRACFNLWVCDPNRPDAPKLVIDDPKLSGPKAYHPCGGVAWHPAGRTLAFPRPAVGDWWIHLIDPTTARPSPSSPPWHSRPGPCSGHPTAPGSRSPATTRPSASSTPPPARCS